MNFYDCNCNECQQTTAMTQYPTFSSYCGAPCERAVILDPLLPAGNNRPRRKNTKAISKKIGPSKPIQAPPLTKKVNCSKNSDQKSQNACENCCCMMCCCNEKNKLNSDSNCIETDQLPETEKKPKMTNACAERNMKDFLYDNPDLKEENCKKSSPCSDILDCMGGDSEVWLLQVPKCFDPKSIEINADLGSAFKSNQGKAECSAIRFKDNISFVCIAPEKALEYELICDNIKLIKPAGKIVVTRNKSSILSGDSMCDEEQSDSCSEDLNSEECNSDSKDATKNPIASKKLEKKINDQRFTIETTVTVENCSERGDRKRNRKSKHQDANCLPLMPPQPNPLKKKKSIKEELSWMNDC